MKSFIFILVIYLQIEGYHLAGFERAKIFADVEPKADGNYYLDDMILNPEQYQEKFRKGSRRKRSGVASSEYRWPNGVLPYKFSIRMPDSDKEIVRRAVQRFNDDLNGCIQIREANEDERDFVQIVKGNGCSAFLGKSKTGGRQPISLANGCYDDRTIAHMFIHALGFNHEHTRPDRDQYITINKDNIMNRMEFNFEKNEDLMTFGVPFDPLSIMMYKADAFSNGKGKYTIESKMPDIPTSKLGTSKWLTEFDILKLKRMYNCRETEPDVEMEETDFEQNDPNEIVNKIKQNVPSSNLPSFSNLSTDPAIQADAKFLDEFQDLLNKNQTSKLLTPLMSQLRHLNEKFRKKLKTRIQNSKKLEKHNSPIATSDPRK